MSRKDEMTLAGRIKIGMASVGIATPAELARKMKMNRQTIHRWVDGQGEKLTPKSLYKLADALNVNPQWLAQGPPHGPGKPISPSLDEAEIIQIFRALPKIAQDQWVSNGRGLVELTAPRSRSNPFPAKTK